MGRNKPNYIYTKYKVTGMKSKHIDVYEENKMKKLAIYRLPCSFTGYYTA
jgi:hypothetical protein